MKSVDYIEFISQNETESQVSVHKRSCRSNDIFDHPLKESYQAKVIENFNWEDWVDMTKTIKKPHSRSDTRLKNDPYRKKPVSLE